MAAKKKAASKIKGIAAKAGRKPAKITAKKSKSKPFRDTCE